MWKVAILLPCMAFWATAAVAGVTIHYEGNVATDEALERVLSEATAFAKTRRWRVEPIDEKHRELDRTVGDQETTYKGPVRGVVLFPAEMCEPVHLEFGSDRFMQDFVKTQFAGTDTHIAIVDLLKKLQPHFVRLAVEDEGEFWETGNRKQLEKQLATVNGLMVELKKSKPHIRGPVKLPDGRVVDIME